MGLTLGVSSATRTIEELFTRVLFVHVYSRQFCTIFHRNFIENSPVVVRRSSGGSPDVKVIREFDRKS